MLPSGLDPGMVIVFAIILGALVLFATEAVPVDVTAIGIMLALLVVEPVSTMLVEWGLLDSAVYVLRAPGSEVMAVERGLSGFASVATITVLAMFILSAGVRRTGAVQILGRKIGAFTGEDETRQLGATVGIVAVAPSLPPIVVLGLLYVVTALLTSVISNNASVVLMIPVAAEAAVTLGSNHFSFVLAVTFAASTAFMTPIGYQTNLFVYGPGGYEFMDYVKAGAPSRRYSPS